VVAKEYIGDEDFAGMRCRFGAARRGHQPQGERAKTAASEVE